MTIAKATMNTSKSSPTLLGRSRRSTMDIYQFAKTTNIPVSQSTYDMFYPSVKDGFPIYLSDDIVKWFGYDGTEDQQNN
jgi:hypothetical protein